MKPVGLFLVACLVAAVTTVGAETPDSPPLAPDTSLRPEARSQEPPRARWDHRPGSTRWTMASLKALRTHGRPLTEVEPGDIAEWCPGYLGGGTQARRAFWVGFLSALSKHESTYRAEAVGGGGLWYGLLQILPATARGYGCKARSGAALKNGPDNLSCAIRIMAVTVPRDRAIAIRDSRWRGVAADWGPMRNAAKTDDMKRWLRQQEYCHMTRSLRPVPRPETLVPPKS